MPLAQDQDSEPRHVLFACSLNAVRSPMAEGILRHLAGKRMKVRSAGVRVGDVDRYSETVMSELGIDISHHRSKSLDDLGGEQFDLVITVCDNAAEQCPMFPGSIEILHISFPDPAKAKGSEEEILAEFRQVRDDLREKLVPLLREKAQ